MPKKPVWLWKKFVKLLIPTLKITAIVIFALAALVLALVNRIYPGVFVDNTNLSFYTPAQAKLRLEQKLYSRLEKKEFNYNGQKHTINLQLLQASSGDFYTTSVQQAFLVGREGGSFPPRKISSPDFDLTPLQSEIERVEQEVNIPAINAQIKVQGDLIQVTPSQEGLKLDRDKLNESLQRFLKNGQDLPRELPVTADLASFSYDEGLQLKRVLDKIKLTPQKILIKDREYVLDLNTLLGLLDLNTQDGLDKTASLPLLSEPKLTKYLNSLAQEVNVPVKEPLFQFEPGAAKVSEFEPPQVGQQLNIAQSAQILTQALLSENSQPITLPVDEIQPKNKLTNEMGIKELIGRGVSHFRGSIANRIYNIGLAASRINGVLIAPGEEFSFVNTVGDISAATGYRQAYVIKSGRTVLDDGGGVCQVSTTIFRSALNSGLPITERHAHAYRVAYYEQGFDPGLDATIFHPSVDFKFKNDTPAHILIQAYVVGTSLYVDLYGTSDGRVAEISKSTITNITPAPPELRQDDPTLPKGEVKQVDWAASGASVVFSRKVSRDGQELINEKFYSNYRPWQAVFLVGTKE